MSYCDYSFSCSDSERTATTQIRWSGLFKFKGTASDNFSESNHSISAVLEITKYFVFPNYQYSVNL